MLPVHLVRTLLSPKTRFRVSDAFMILFSIGSTLVFNYYPTDPDNINSNDPTLNPTCTCNDPTAYVVDNACQCSSPLVFDSYGTCNCPENTYGQYDNSGTLNCQACGSGTKSQLPFPASWQRSNITFLPPDLISPVGSTDVTQWYVPPPLYALSYVHPLLHH